VGGVSGVSGEDYDAIDTTVRFAAGAARGARACFGVTVPDDRRCEPDFTVALTLTPLLANAEEPAAHTLSVTDDDWMTSFAGQGRVVHLDAGGTRFELLDDRPGTHGLASPSGAAYDASAGITYIVDESGELGAVTDGCARTGSSTRDCRSRMWLGACMIPVMGRSI
jgi:hypothetical protein